MNTKSLHVGIDATCWSNDRGYGRFTRELIKALAKRDSSIRYTLAFDQRPQGIDDTIPDGVDVVCAQSKTNIGDSTSGESSRSFSYIWKMGSLARQLKCDVFFFPAVYSYFPLLARTPCVVCYHDAIAERFPDLIFPKKMNFWMWQLKTYMARKQSVRAMTISQSSARDIEQFIGIDQNRIDVITEAADPVFRPINDRAKLLAMRERFSIPQEADLLVYVGGFNRHKNILRLIEAMPEILAAQPQTYLAIVGSLSGQGFWDNNQELQAAASATDELKQHIRFTGRISDEQLAVLLNTANALVLPSLWEGFGLPAVEAMACGRPVLGSNCGSLPEVVGKAGMYFDPQDTHSIAETAIDFLRNHRGQEYLAHVALKKSKEYNWDKAAELAEQSFLRCHAQHLGIEPDQSNPPLPDEKS